MANITVGAARFMVSDVAGVRPSKNPASKSALQPRQVFLNTADAVMCVGTVGGDHIELDFRNAAGLPGEQGPEGPPGPPGEIDGINDVPGLSKALEDRQMIGGVADTLRVKAEDGSVERTLSNRFGSPVNVRDRGVVGNGSTNDAGTLRAIAANVRTYGDTIQIPPGRYLINDAEGFLLDYTTLAGEPSSDRKGAPVQGSGMQTTVLASAYADVYGVKIQGNGGVSSHVYSSFGNLTITRGGVVPLVNSKGLHLRNLAYTQFDNINIQGLGEGAYLESVLICSFNNLNVNNNLIGLKISQGTGFSLSNANTFFAPKIRLNSKWGIQGGPCTTMTMINLDMEGCGTTGDLTTGGMDLTFRGDTQGRTGLNIFGGYIEGIRGEAAFVLTNLSTTPCVHTFEALNFKRFKDTGSRVCIKLVGRHILNLKGCGFDHANGYIPSADTPYFDYDPTLTQINYDSSCYFASALELGDAPQPEALVELGVAVLTAASGTWTPPAKGVMFDIALIGQGGPGGSGARGDTASARYGGGGGAPGAVTRLRRVSRSDLAASCAYVIGQGTTGGVAAAADNTSGLAGSAGGATSFTLKPGRVARAPAGGTGAGGTTTSGAGAAGVSPGNAAQSYIPPGANGSSGTGVNSAAFGYSPSGGGGGGLTTAGVAANGGGATSAAYETYTSATDAATGGGVAPGGAGATPTPGTSDDLGKGGGGGASNPTGPGGNGGGGGFPGGGGGGGGASGPGNPSGAGGAGAAGAIIIRAWGYRRLYG